MSRMSEQSHGKVTQKSRKSNREVTEGGYGQGVSMVLPALIRKAGGDGLISELARVEPAPLDRVQRDQRQGSAALMLDRQRACSPATATGAISGTTNGGAPEKQINHINHRAGFSPPSDLQPEIGSVSINTYYMSRQPKV